MQHQTLLLTDNVTLTVHHHLSKLIQLMDLFVLKPVLMDITNSLMKQAKLGVDNANLLAKTVLEVPLTVSSLAQMD